MTRHLRPAIVFVVLALAALACAGGSVLNESMSCSGGQCQGSFGRLSGSFTVDIQPGGINAGEAVPVTVEVTSGAGRVEVSITAPDGTTASGVAEPGMPATVTGVATGMMFTVDDTTLDEEGFSESGEVGGFQLVLKALDESAEDVTYRLAYSLP